MDLGGLGELVESGWEARGDLTRVGDSDDSQELVKHMVEPQDTL